MLSEKTIAAIATALKLELPQFKEAITVTEAKDFDIPELKIFTPAELATRDTGVKSTAYESGKKAGAEILIKEIKTEAGLEFDGKDKEDLVTAIKRVPAASEDVELLRKSVKDAEKKAQEAEGSLAEVKLRTKVYGFFPKELKDRYTDDELWEISKVNGFSFKPNDAGEPVISRNGAEIKDEKLLTHISPSDALNKFFKEEKKWITETPPPPKGRGGSSSADAPAVYAKYSEVERAWVKEGKSTNSADFATHVQAIAKTVQDFDMNS